ncbi:rRNA processing protein [Malassezia yamatoensis]|uniref:Pre-rRNA-processing protein n=1 Tax=Malassezia yamatoensis TaxID=253288 RepID=A0AAJ6CJN2_9BASI|nr:rRNA processing protein [Malassezia yamatoensis]
MTQGTKRKAVRPNDFKKTKPKLGKGKQDASNATDTSFQTRNIALPQQSVSVDRSQNLTTKRKQTLTDLVQNSRHSSAHMRRDAMNGLVELITTYPILAETETSRLINVSLPMLSDEDPSVRNRVQQYLKVLFEYLSLAQVTPYLNSMLLFTTSAMSHISMPVRMDALLVMERLICKAGKLVTQGWEAALESEARPGNSHGQRVLQAFFAMLGVANDAQNVKQGGHAVRSGTTASVELQPAGRLRVLRTLSQFVMLAMQESSSDTSLPLWCFQLALESVSEREQFECIMNDSQPEAIAQDMPWVESARMDVRQLASMNVMDAFLAGSMIQSAGKSDSGSVYQQLVKLLHNSLIATLLDSIPSALSLEGATQNVHLELVAEILTISASLWRVIILQHLELIHAQSKSRPLESLECLHRLLNHLTPYFPTSERDGNMLQLNGIYCELVALASVAQQNEIRIMHRKPIEQNAQAINRVLVYLTTQFKIAPDELTPAIYRSLIPTFWLLLTVPRPDSDDCFMKSLLQHFIATPTQSPLKPIAFEFLARLALMHTFTTLRMPLVAVHQPRSIWQEWFASLPRVLWEASTFAVSRSKGTLETRQQSEKFARTIIVFLQRVFVEADGKLFDPETLGKLSPSIQPLFGFDHPVRGRIAGPYARLSTNTQTIARAFAMHANLDIVS